MLPARRADPSSPADPLQHPSSFLTTAQPPWALLGPGWPCCPPQPVFHAWHSYWLCQQLSRGNEPTGEQEEVASPSAPEAQQSWVKEGPSLGLGPSCPPASTPLVTSHSGHCISTPGHNALMMSTWQHNPFLSHDTLSLCQQFIHFQNTRNFLP